MQWKDGYMYDGHGCRIEVMKRVHQMAYGLNDAESLRLLEWLNWKVRRRQKARREQASEQEFVPALQDGSPSVCEWLGRGD